MILHNNYRLIPELTEGYDDEFADILIDGKCIRSICEPGTARAEGEDETCMFDAGAKLY